LEDITGSILFRAVVRDKIY